MKMKSLKQCDNLLEVFLFLENAFKKGFTLTRNPEGSFYYKQLISHLKPYQEELIHNKHDNLMGMYELINHLKINRSDFETILINLSEDLVLKRPK